MSFQTHKTFQQRFIGEKICLTTFRLILHFFCICQTFKVKCGESSTKNSELVKSGNGLLCWWWKVWWVVLKMSTTLNPSLKWTDYVNKVKCDACNHAISAYFYNCLTFIFEAYSWFVLHRTCTYAISAAPGVLPSKLTVRNIWYMELIVQCKHQNVLAYKSFTIIVLQKLT